MADRAAGGRIDHLLVVMIAGQVALAVIAAVHGARPLFLVGVPVDIYVIHSHLAWLELAALLTMFGWYARHARAPQGEEPDIESKRLFTVLGIVTLLSVLQAPTTSRDIYAYVALGRVATVFDLDPFVATYPLVAGDPFRAFVWILAPSSYGPAALLLFIPAAWLSQIHPALGVIFLKLVASGAFLACAWFIYQLAAKLGRSPKRALVLFGLNPLMLHELVGEAHVDVWPVAFVLAGLWFVHRERVRVGSLVALLPVMFKVSFIVTAAATAWVLAVRRSAAAVAVMALVLAAVSISFYIAFDPDLRYILQITDPHALGRENTLYHWLEVALAQFGVSNARDVVTRIAQVVMIAVALFGAWRISKIRTLDDLVDELAVLFLLLLLVGPRLWPWYLSWVMPFAVLTRNAAVRDAALLLSCTSLLLYMPLEYPRLRAAAILAAVLLPAADWLVTSRRR